MNTRNTIQKQLILDAVAALNIHATAEEVYEYIAQSNPSISKATVYRNLSQMTGQGVLLHAGNFFGAAHYDHNTHSHYHGVCVKCKKVFDVDGDLGDLSDILSKVTQPDAFEITGYHISFSGVCSACKLSAD